MHNWKDVKKETWNKLDDGIKEMIGEINISYDDEFADFMFNNTGSDVFIKLKDHGPTVVGAYLVCEKGAEKHIRNRFLEIKNTIEIFEVALDTQIKYINAKYEDLLCVYEIGLPSDAELAECVSLLVNKFWPFILKTDDVKEKIDKEENDNKVSLKSIEKTVSDNKPEEKHSELIQGIIDESANDTEENQESYKLLKHLNRIKFIEMRIGDRSLITNFYLYEDEFKSISIKCYDHTGLIEQKDFNVMGQFSYYIYPISPDKILNIVIEIDGMPSYRQKIHVPQIFRLKNNYESSNAGTYQKNVDKDGTETEETKAFDLKELDFDTNELSKAAIKLMEA